MIRVPVQISCDHPGCHRTVETTGVLVASGASAWQSGILGYHVKPETPKGWWIGRSGGGGGGLMASDHALTRCPEHNNPPQGV